MPNKLQFRLLSHSGELLNVVTCHAGRISVLRAAASSDLRPYQRALSGSSGKENIQVLCDGVQFRSVEHTLIGFGELSPTSGLSVRDFISQLGASKEASEALLRSVGLESIIDKRCSDLSTEQEARLRLVAATSDPSKAVILNDPFEHISGQWRERIAELLISFVETQNALVVIPSLSYRPESWINNQVIERIEVGQTSQGTIGFGSAGSASNAAMADLINKVRQDPRFAAQATQEGDNVSGGLAGAAFGLSPSSSSTDSRESVHPSAHRSIFKVTSITLGAGLTACIGLIMVGIGPNKSQRGGNTASKLEHRDQGQTRLSSADEKLTEPSDTNKSQHSSADSSGQRTGTQSASTSLHNSGNSSSEVFALDLYPTTIKLSLVDTVKGTNHFAPSNSAEAEKSSSVPVKSSGGNLFTLLEKASNSGSQAPNSNEPPQGSRYADESAVEDVDSDSEPTEEETRREEIRNRFLAAIQAAAERRQPSFEDEE